MAGFGSLTLTTAGSALLAKVQTGTTLTFSRAAVGSGSLSSGTSLSSLTALISEQKSLSINSLFINESKATVRVILNNVSLSTGFYIRELGIFATAPDHGEILYAVANAGDEGVHLPAVGTDVVEYIWDAVMVISNASSVTATIDDSNTYVTQKEYKTRLATLDPLGIPKSRFCSILPDYHLWCDGKTIGDTSSNATSRANADTKDLFTVLWSSGLSIFDCSGSSSTRGTDAATDFAAHKTIALPKLNGRGLIGCDNLGGTSANVVTSDAADIIGGSGGEENHTLTASEIPSHTHNVENVGQFHGSSECNRGGFLSACNTTLTSTSTGGGRTHNNMQPWIACNWIMRYK